MTGSKQYGKGFWSASASSETIIAGIARGFYGDLQEWDPALMKEIIENGIAKGYEAWLSKYGHYASSSIAEDDDNKTLPSKDNIKQYLTKREYIVLESIYTKKLTRKQTAHEISIAENSDYEVSEQRIYQIKNNAANKIAKLIFQEKTEK